MQRKTDHDSLDLVFANELAIVARVGHGAARLVDFNRESHGPAGVGNGDSNSPGAEVDAEDTCHHEPLFSELVD